MFCPQFRGWGALEPVDVAVRAAAARIVHPDFGAQSHPAQWIGSLAAFGLDWLSGLSFARAAARLRVAAVLALEALQQVRQELLWCAGWPACGLRRLRRRWI